MVGRMNGRWLADLMDEQVGGGTETVERWRKRWQVVETLLWWRNWDSGEERRWRSGWTVEWW